MVASQQLAHTNAEADAEKEEEVGVERAAGDVAKELSSRLAKDVVVLDVREKSDFTSYFVIATAETPRHLDYLSNCAKDALDAAGFASHKAEGQSAGGWVALDSGPITVHIFTDEQRAHYDLDGLWGEAREVVRYPG